MANILVVDDEPDIVEVITFTLETKGHIVESAKDGAEGIAKVKKVQPDLIILDIMLPKINGYEICRLIRKESLSMPIIMLTGHGTVETAREGLEKGETGRCGELEESLHSPMPTRVGTTTPQRFGSPCPHQFSAQYCFL